MSRWDNFKGGKEGKKNEKVAGTLRQDSRRQKRKYASKIRGMFTVVVDERKWSLVTIGIPYDRHALLARASAGVSTQVQKKPGHKIFPTLHGREKG